MDNWDWLKKVDCSRLKTDPAYGREIKEAVFRCMMKSDDVPEWLHDPYGVRTAPEAAAL
jgi:hypothetical protein